MNIGTNTIMKTLQRFNILLDPTGNLKYLLKLYKFMDASLATCSFILKHRAKNKSRKKESGAGLDFISFYEEKSIEKLHFCHKSVAK